MENLPQGTFFVVRIHIPSSLQMLMLLLFPGLPAAPHLLTLVLACGPCFLLHGATTVYFNRSYFLGGRGSHLWHMEVPRLGVHPELQLPAYAIYTAMRDPSSVCDLHHSSQKYHILNPPSKARDQTAASWFLVGFLSAAPQQELQIAIGFYHRFCLISVPLNLLQSYLGIVGYQFLCPSCLSKWNKPSSCHGGRTCNTFTLALPWKALLALTLEQDGFPFDEAELIPRYLENGV